MPIAIPLVAALPDILFVLLMVVLGTGLAFIIVPPLVQFARNLPFVGGAIGSIIAAAFLAQQLALRNWMSRNVDPVVNVLQAVVGIAGNSVDAFLRLIVANLQAMQAVAQAAGGQAGNVGQRIIQLAARVLAVETGLGSVTTGLGDLVDQVRRALSVTVPALIGQAIAGLWATVQAAIHVEHAAAVVLMGQAEQLAQALFAQAQLAMQAGDQLLSHALLHTAQALAAEITAVQTGAKTYTDGLFRQAEGQLTDIIKVAIPAAILPLSLEISRIAEQQLTQTDQCINPTCAALDAGLDLFQLLQLGAELLIMVALVSFALSDPRTAARELVQGQEEMLGLVAPIVGAFGIRV